MQIQWKHKSSTEWRDVPHLPITSVHDAIPIIDGETHSGQNKNIDYRVVDPTTGQIPYILT